MRAQIVTIIAAFALAACGQQEDQSITCPVPQVGKVGAVLRETPSQIAEAGRQLHYGGNNAIAEVAAGVRARHPSADNSEVINFLLTAYCPELNADPALDKERRRQAMRAFARRAEASLGR